MPNLAVSVSDPVSAIVIAALDFLTTPVGQEIAGDVRAEIVNIVKFIHSRLPALSHA